MDLSEVGALLDPKPLPLETGYERLPSGALHVAVRTDMHGCSGEMLEWWFRWRCDTQKYVWWHPIDHVSSHWQGELSPDTHIGSEHVVSEFFSGLPAADLIVQFREPSEFFDADAYAKARDSGAVTGVVVGRTGMTHTPPRTDDGRVLGGRLLHIARDTEWGMALRSHFYMGADLPDLGVSPEEIEALVPDEFGQGLLQHAYDEFTYLSRFLPSLFVAEHRDTRPPRAPW
ncbi:MAG TPA: hypothetical protein VF328_22015 [Mycobacterium sp.]|jgi:hypothetical protein